MHTSKHYMDSTYSPTTKPLYRGTQIVWYALSILELFLLLRFALKLLGANAEAGFTSFIYNSTHFFVSPFLSVFGVSTVDGNVIEWTTLLAMFLYWALALGITKLLVMGRTVSTFEAAQSLDEQERL